MSSLTLFTNMSWLTICTITLCLITMLIYIYYRYKFSYWKRRGFDSLPPQIPFGNMKDVFLVRKNLEEGIKAWYDSFSGPYAGVYLFTHPGLIVKDPELLKLIFVKDFNVFPDRGLYMNVKKEPNSGHLFRLEGEEWRIMRNKLSPSFTIGKLKMMFPTLVMTGSRLCKSLDTSASNGESINVEELSIRFSSDIIANVIFGLDSNNFKGADNDFLLMAKDLYHNLSRYRSSKLSLLMLAPQILKMLEYFGAKTVQETQRRFINKMVGDVIEFREKNGITRPDMMQLFIQLKNQGEVNEKDTVTKDDFINNNKKNFTLDQLSALAYTFFFTGFETSASTINFLIYECALNPDIQEKIRSDIDTTLAKYNGDITYDSIFEMKYLDKAISESLRKYPILPFITRYCLKDYPIPNTNLVIPKDTRIIVSVTGLHRDETFFKNATKFDPERFTDPETVTPFSYLPYGEGPRNCIGKRLGQMMVSVGIISILRDYKISVCKDTEIPLNESILSYTRKAVNPITVRIDKRNDAAL